MDITKIILTVIFWCSCAGVAYAYLAYPLVIYIFSRAFGKPPVTPVVADAQLPRVALLIAAHNEASVIEERILNALALDYPSDRLQIVIASDGSDDGTVEICRRHEPRVRVLAFQNRGGKAATINAALSHLDAEIVALSDANTFMDPSALRSLVRWFADPAVGSVCGRLVLWDSHAGRNADSLYWRYENFLKECEGRLGGPLGANGAIYAIRRSLLQPLPPGAVVDDLVIPLMAKMHSGCRIIYDARAIAHEQTPPELRAEFRRRSRIGIGGFQAITYLWPLLGPRFGWTAFAFWSHKILRWIGPFLMLSALVSTLALAGGSFFQMMLAAQVAFYGLCAIGALIPPAGPLVRPLRVFPMFVGMNLALLVGFFLWLRGRQTGIWSRTMRLPESGPAAPH